MSNVYHQHLLELATGLVTLAAWLKGWWPERMGASAYLFATILLYILQHTIGLTGMSTVLLSLDGLVGVVFLVLAVRYTSLWLGGAMLLQGVQFSLHAFYDVTHRPFDRLFAVVNNVVSWGVLACILAGTIAAWRGARRREL